MIYGSSLVVALVSCRMAPNYAVVAAFAAGAISLGSPPQAANDFAANEHIGVGGKKRLEQRAPTASIATNIDEICHRILVRSAPSRRRDDAAPAHSNAALRHHRLSASSEIAAMVDTKVLSLTAFLTQDVNCVSGARQKLAEIGPVTLRCISPSAPVFIHISPKRGAPHSKPENEIPG
jgi:hypothetical protein